MLKDKIIQELIYDWSFYGLDFNEISGRLLTHLKHELMCQGAFPCTAVLGSILPDEDILRMSLDSPVQLPLRRVLCTTSICVPSTFVDSGLPLAQQLNNDIFKIWNGLPMALSPAELIPIPEGANMYTHGSIGS